MNQDKIKRKAMKILAQYGVRSTDLDFQYLLENVLVMRKDCDMPWVQITRWIEERLG